MSWYSILTKIAEIELMASVNEFDSIKEAEESFKSKLSHLEVEFKKLLPISSKWSI